MLEYEWGNAAPMIFTGDETNNPITTAATTTTHHHHHHPSDLDHTGRYFFDPFSTSNPNFNDPNPTHTTTLPPSSSSTSSSSSPYSSHYNTTGFYNQHHQNTHPPPLQFHSFPDPRLNFYPNTNPNLPLTPPMLSLETLTAVSTPQLHHQAAGGTNYMNMMLPKQEPCTVMDYSSTTSNNNNSSSANNNNINNNNRIGLNLGGRTYFSAADDHDFVDRLYRRGGGNGRGGGAGGGYGGGGGLVGNSARCQAEGCNADLTHSKHYHRRHKVCEFHSKASTVIAAGLTQRFCQQCSRFHLLTEFDNGKRSCRRRLADHNRRRRKSNQMVSQDSRISQADQNSRSKSSSETPQRSPSDSGIHSSSSVTVAVSPPRMSLDCPFKPSRPPAPPPPPSYNVLMTGNAATSAATNSASSTSLFYP